MSYNPFRILPILATAFAFGASAAAAAAEGGTEGSAAGSPPDFRPADPRLRLNLHVFGLSYHPDREGTRRSDLDNELNFGLGLNYIFHNDDRGVASVETGFYYDSGRDWAKFAGIGYQFKLGARWGLGADLLAIQSETYNDGRAFVAPLPRLSYDFGPVQLNAVYVPRFQQYNLFAVFALYITIPVWK
jgi:hypothetical protein